MKRDWTCVDDLVAGVIAALDRPLGYEVINLGRGEPVLMADFVRVIERLVGKKALLETPPAPASEPKVTFADIGKARRLRYCARPLFAAERLVWAGEGAQVRYRLPGSALQGHRIGQQRPIELRLSASEFVDRIELLVPPPRKHRHRYFGYWRRTRRGGNW